MLINTPLIKNGLIIFAAIFMAAFFIGPQFTREAQVVAEAEQIIVRTGNGSVVEERRDVSGFDIIKVTDGIDLYLTQGHEESVLVRAEENCIDQVVTRVKDGTLYLEIKGMINRLSDLEIMVTVRDLKELHVQGGADVFAEEGLKLDNLQLNCSGGSDTHLKLQAASLYCKTSGGSDVLLSGEVENLTAETSGGSDLKAGDLRTVNAKIRSSGASDVWVYVTGEANLVASGASDIHLLGDPGMVYSKTSGGADIHE